MAGAAARGQSPLVVLAYGNRHYDGGGLVVSRAAIDAYANYAGFVASELKGQVRQFEIWNEWNSGFGSKPKVNRGDAQAYVRMLAPAAAAIHAANPEAEVIGGVTAGVDLEWFRELIAAGGLAHLDAISAHSYTLFRREINPEGAIVSLDKLHALLEEAEPQREIPVYVTEIGWPTNKGKHGVERARSGHVPGAVHAAGAHAAVDPRRMVVRPHRRWRFRYAGRAAIRPGAAQPRAEARIAHGEIRGRAAAIDRAASRVSIPGGRLSGDRRGFRRPLGHGLDDEPSNSSPGKTARPASPTCPPNMRRSRRDCPPTAIHCCSAA